MGRSDSDLVALSDDVPDLEHAVLEGGGGLVVVPAGFVRLDHLGQGVVAGRNARLRGQLVGTLAGHAIAGRMKRKDALAAKARSTPTVLILTGAEDRLLTDGELTSTAAALSKSGIPAVRVSMESTGHGISDAGIKAAQEVLKGILPMTDPVTPSPFPAAAEGAGRNGGAKTGTVRLSLGQVLSPS